MENHKLHVLKKIIAQKSEISKEIMVIANSGSFSRFLAFAIKNFDNPEKNIEEYVTHSINEKRRIINILKILNDEFFLMTRSELFSTNEIENFMGHSLLDLMAKENNAQNEIFIQKMFAEDLTKMHTATY